MRVLLFVHILHIFHHSIPDFLVTFGHVNHTRKYDVGSVIVHYLQVLLQLGLLVAPHVLALCVCEPCFTSSDLLVSHDLSFIGEILCEKSPTQVQVLFTISQKPDSEARALVEKFVPQYANETVITGKDLLRSVWIALKCVNYGIFWYEN